MLQLGYAIAETYPVSIVKPGGLKWLTAVMAVAQMAGHTLLLVLSRDLGRHIKYAKTCVAFFGITAAGGKAAGCYLICKMSDKKMPTDHAGWFCLAALSLLQGLGTFRCLHRAFPPEPDHI